MTTNEVINEAFRRLIRNPDVHEVGAMVVHESCPRTCEFVRYETDGAIIRDVQNGEIKVPASEVVSAAKLMHYSKCIHVGLNPETTHIINF